MSSPIPFPDFEHHDVDVTSRMVGDIKIHTRKHGKGEPLLLIHGYPQTSHLWNRVAPRLGQKFTVIIPDLRGYGRSSKPKGSDSHVEYSKKEMAEDMVQVMKHFGYDSFHIVAHDRGARVAHRLALDNPEKVKKMMVLDITPTVHMYEHTDMMFAAGYWHWFFLIQPTPYPSPEATQLRAGARNALTDDEENVILADPSTFWKMHCQRRAPDLWTEEDLTEYQGSWFKPEAVHASCEDYRAAATIDLEHDRHSRSTGDKLAITDLRVLWGKQGIIEKMGDAVEVWKSYSGDKTSVSGRGMDCGHYIPEEKPDELLKEIEEFLG